MAVKTLIVLLLASLVSAQTVSFAPQGAASLKALTGKRIKGVGLLSATVCSSVPLTVMGGMVYQKANSLGISTINPGDAAVLVRRTVQFHWSNFLLAGISDVSLLIPILGEAKLFAASSTSVISMLLGHGVADTAAGQLRTLTPDPSELLGNLLDPVGVLAINGACAQKMMVIVYSPKTQAGTYPLFDTVTPNTIKPASVPWSTDGTVEQVIANRNAWILEQARNGPLH